MSFRQFAGRLAGIGLLLSGAAGALAEPTLSLDNTAAPPGATNLVPVNITVDTNVVSFQFDLWYSTNYLTPGAPIGGDALSDQGLYYNVVSPGQYRVLAVSFTDTPLTNGVAVYVPFTIASNAPDHDEPLMLSNVVFVSAQAFSVPVNVNSNAILSITVPPRFTAIFPTNGDGVHLELTGTPGRTYVIQAAANLSEPQWTPLVTNTNISGILPFDDVSAGIFPVRFYRAQFDH
jgi:Cohesin domain